MILIRAAIVLVLVGAAGCAAAESPPEEERRERKRAGPPPMRKGKLPPRPARTLPTDVVVRVVDGDTVELRRLGTVRLIGIDTPEVYGGEECYGREASAFTKRLLPTGARVRYAEDVEPHDRYARTLVYLYRGRRLVNAELVRRGYAQQMTIPPNVRFADRFRALARRARRLGRGLWGTRACAPGLERARDRSCADFRTQAAAQRYVRRRPKEAAGMDGDGDGRVCETLP